MPGVDDNCSVGEVGEHFHSVAGLQEVSTLGSDHINPYVLQYRQKDKILPFHLTGLVISSLSTQALGVISASPFKKY